MYFSMVAQYQEKVCNDIASFEQDLKDLKLWPPERLQGQCSAGVYI